MNELDLGRLLKSFCDKNGVPLGKEINLLKLLADVGGVAEELFTKNSKVSTSIKAITGEDSMMVCPNCGSHVIVEYKTCIACGEELFEGAVAQQKPAKAPAPVKEEPKDVEYPSVAAVNKMKKPELEQWVNLLELEVDMDGKLKDIRDAIKAEIKELKNPEPIKTSEEEIEEDDVLDDLEENQDLDDEFEDEEDEEELEEMDEDDSETEDEEELEDDDDFDSEEEFEEEEDDDLDEEFEEEELDEEDEDEEDDSEFLEDEFEDDEDIEEEDDDEFEEELDEEDEDEDLDEEDDDLDDEFEEEELEDDDEFEEEVEEEPAPKKTTKKKVAKKAAKKTSKKVTKKAPAKKPLSDKKAEREAKRAALKKKIPALAKNPANLEKLEHSERVSLQTMLGEEQGNKKSLAELKGPNMIKQLKIQLTKWKKQNAKK